MSCRPQEFAPNRGYSSYFPPDQQAKDQERFKQLETLLDVSTNRPKELATDNKLLKEKAKELEDKVASQLSDTNSKLGICINTHRCNL